MADQKKAAIPGKVQKDKSNKRKFKVEKGGDSEIDVEIEVLEDGDYEVEKLSMDGLPTQMKDGNPIRWFNNFAVKKNGKYIKQKYRVTIPGISNLGKSRLVIYEGSGDPYYYTGKIENDTFELSNGDPASGGAP
ncbi:hypothetical protein FBQ81_13240 [Chloroflexi bacterium CFX6]|nr:hypothetical protein [Chloroflexi bacterium CFX6]